MTVLAGHADNVLDAALDAATTAAIGRSACKVLTSLPDGRHAEFAMPGCNGVDRLRVTHCHMHLERADASLRHALVPAALRGLPIDRVNAYISPAGTGARLHFDSRTVIVVQLVGEKRWQVSADPAVPSPEHNCVAPNGASWVEYAGQRLPIPTDLLEHTLRPGDWLLMEKATWHRTSTPVGSVSVTLALPG